MQIGILGGTFNPIHNAHIAMAKSALQALQLDRILLVPAFTAPHKQDEEMLPAEMRLKLCTAASEAYDFMEASDTEVRRGGVSYTVETLRELKAVYPDAAFTLLIGDDMLKAFPHWRGAEEIAGMARLAVFPRTGGGEEAERLAAYVRAALHADVTVLAACPEEISSTAVREAVSHAGSVRTMVPRAVEQLIYEEGLYLDSRYRSICAELKERLSPKRFRHTAGVVSQAVYLSGLYAPGDEGLAREALMAALLHDCAKELNKGELMVLGGDDYPDILPVQHAFAGAVVAQNCYGETDGAVLQAVRRHCTGEEGMTLLDDIVYLADLTEPNRSFDGVERYRRLLLDGPEAAMRASLEDTVSRVGANGFLHPATRRAAAYFGIK